MSDDVDTVDLDRFVAPSETLIRVVEIVAAYLLAGLFAVGVIDLFISILGLVRTGDIFDPDAGIDRILNVIDKALLLFIIVELYQTVVAYTREESVTRIVIVAGLIAISRKIISFRPGDFAGVTELLANAGAYAVLLLALVVAYYVVQTTDPGDVPTGGFREPSPERGPPDGADGDDDTDGDD
jgi:uncharacterized membrane protein (DUF373 family)